MGCKKRSIKNFFNFFRKQRMLKLNTNASVTNQVTITDPVTGATSTWTANNSYYAVNVALKNLRKLQQGGTCKCEKAVARVSKFLNTPIERLQICTIQHYNFESGDNLPKEMVELIIKKRQLTQEMRSLQIA